MVHSIIAVDGATTEGFSTPATKTYRRATRFEWGTPLKATLSGLQGSRCALVASHLQNNFARLAESQENG
jgi:hypothetical protein